MSTLAEIEAAAEALPLEQKQELLRFLASRLNGHRQPQRPGNLGEFAGALPFTRRPAGVAAAGAWRVGMTGLLDTNVALYLLGGRMAAPQQWNLALNFGQTTRPWQKCRV